MPLLANRQVFRDLGKLPVDLPDLGSQLAGLKPDIYRFGNVSGIVDPVPGSHRGTHQRRAQRQSKRYRRQGNSDDRASGIQRQFCPRLQKSSAITHHQLFELMDFCLDVTQIDRELGCEIDK